ncbi:1420_t:CDS:2 [Acaulospora morrowiae]|uniref:1420_t:CDS:1 n=1 Tax=Acaulospora morrowiae TaxID=94023 RepID=A0A9N9DJD0_9GLOM|nr:1420_t:CDS:2 [Acaulospora morrowiae]
MTSTEISTENVETSASKSEYNKQGNDHFVNERYALAVESYTRALEITEINEPESAVMFYLKRAKCYLQLERFTDALCDTETILTRDPQHTKAALFRSKAFIALKRYTEAVDTLTKLKKAAKECNETIATALQHAKKLVIESRDGNYNIVDILDELPLEGENGGSCLNCYLDHADYISDAIELRDTGSKGMGWFASREIPINTLVMAVKAFSVVFSSEEPLQVNYRLRDMIADRIRKDPELGCEVYRLYAGPDLVSYSKIDNESLRKVDYDRILEIIHYNSFNPDDLFRYFNDQGDMTSECGRGLWIAPSFFNHKCVDNNISKIFLGDFMFLRTSREIHKDDELTIQYKSPLDPERSEELRSYGFNCQCRLCQLDSSESSVVSHRRAELLEKFDTTIFPRLKLVCNEGVSDPSLLNDFTRLVTELRGLRRKNQDLDFPSIQLRHYLTELLHLLGKYDKEAEECSQLFHFHVRHDTRLSCKVAFKLATLSTMGISQDIDWCAMWFAGLRVLLYVDDKKGNYGDAQHADIIKIAQKFFKQAILI